MSSHCPGSAISAGKSTLLLPQALQIILYQASPFWSNWSFNYKRGKNPKAPFIQIPKYCPSILPLFLYFPWSQDLIYAKDFMFDFDQVTYLLRREIHLPWLQLSEISCLVQAFWEASSVVRESQSSPEDASSPPGRGAQLCALVIINLRSVPCCLPSRKHLIHISSDLCWPCAQINSEPAEQGSCETRIPLPLLHSPACSVHLNSVLKIFIHF